MLPARLDGSNTIGTDMDGDGLPDIPLVYEMDEGSVVEFPLNFCPGESDGTTDSVCLPGHKDVANTLTVILNISYI